MALPTRRLDSTDMQTARRDALRPIARRHGTTIAGRLAILGTGKMGAAIAARLAGAGFEVTLWNRTRARAVSLGVGQVAETPAAAVRRADVVITSLTGADAIRSAFLGADGAFGGAAPGTLFIEMSTAGPDILAELAPHVAAAGADLVAVPILGAPTMVLAGAATLLAGGDRAAVDRARPMLERLGLVRHVGSAADAARLKLIANSMLAVVVGGAAELQRTGTAAGLDPQEVFWALARLAPGLEARRDWFVGNGHEPALFALRDLHKDLSLAADAFGAEAFGADAFGADASGAPLIDTARQLVADAAALLPDEDIAALGRRAGPAVDASTHAPVAPSDRHAQASAGA